MITSDERTLFLQKFNNYLSASTNILITSHMGPDDDSIASSLGLYHYLHGAYPEKNFSIVYFSQREDRWVSFDGFSVIKFEKTPSYDFSSFDLFIGVDAGEFARFNSTPDFFKTLTGKSICIDHHKNDAPVFDLSIIHPEYSSCAELIYDLFYSDIPVPPPVCEILLMGIMGDTGTFRFVNQHQAHVFAVAERLVELGSISIQSLLARYSSNPLSTFMVVKELVSNASVVTLGAWPQFICSFVSREFIESNAISDPDVSAAAHIFIAQYGTSIRECSWGFVVSPREDGSVSCSFRSRPGSVNVRLLCEGIGLGGGHDRASAIKFREVGVRHQPQECLTFIHSWLKDHSPLL